MSNKIYVGNLPFSTTESQVREEFSKYGVVTDVAMISDRVTGKPKGFCFVEFASSDGAKYAIEKMNNQDFYGRNLRVNIAKPKQPVGSDRYVD